MAGIVARINVQPGQTVEPTTVVAEVIDPARLVVTLGSHTLPKETKVRVIEAEDKGIGTKEFEK